MLLEVIGSEETRPVTPNKEERDEQGNFKELVPGEIKYYLTVKLPSGMTAKVPVGKEDMEMFHKDRARYECGCRPTPAESIAIRKGCKTHDRG